MHVRTLVRVSMGILMAATLCTHVAGAQQVPVASWAVSGRALAVSTGGTVYIPHPWIMERFTTDGTALATWSIDAYGVPEAAAVSPAGIVMVTNDNWSALPFASDGTELPGWAFMAWDVGQPWAQAVASDANGLFYFALNEHLNLRVQVCTAAGTTKRIWLTPGLCYGIAVDANGNVFVGDADHGVVNVYSSTGSYLRQLGAPPTPIGALHGIAVAGNGDVYVVDSANNRVLVYANDGTYLSEMGGSGLFTHPTDIAFDGANYLYVLDAGRVQKFGTLSTPVGTATWGSIKARYR